MAVSEDVDANKAADESGIVEETSAIPGEGNYPENISDTRDFNGIEEDQSGTAVSADEADMPSDQSLPDSTASGEPNAKAADTPMSGDCGKNGDNVK